MLFTCGESNMSQNKIIVIGGPTASGKSALAIDVALAVNGVAVNCDSMQVYSHMPIISACPTKEDKDIVEHRLFEIYHPSVRGNVVDWLHLAVQTIKDIWSQNKIPVVVGGTGLYIDSFLNNTTFFDNANSQKVREELYKELKERGIDALYNELLEIDSEAAKKIHPNNEVRVIRALEVYRLTGKTLTEQNAQSHKNESVYEPLYIGIAYKDREILYNRINKRVDLMMEAGLLEEAKSFYKEFASQTAVNAIGYKELKPYLSGEKTLNECLEHLKQSTRRYAKRQLTWFNRNENINWVYPDEYDNLEKLYEKATQIAEDFMKGD
jgi:tRNA dimethylallyltransferase